MKITELQIGDWVHVNPISNKVEPHDSRVLSIRREYTGQVYIEGGYKDIIPQDGEYKWYGWSVGIEDLSPIPLTPEILEKIGFSKIPQPGCSNLYHWILEKYEEGTDCLLYRIEAYSNPFRGMYISIDNFGDCEPINFGKQIESLHEFQHALRLCGIKNYDA